jgi:hypothetical protein
MEQNHPPFKIPGVLKSHGRSWCVKSSTYGVDW